MRGPKTRIAVVTGSTAGIGLATVEALVKAGYHVVVSSRHEDDVENTLQSLRQKYGDSVVSGLVCHVGHKADRDNLVAHTKQLGDKLDALVLNVASSTTIGPILQTSTSHWDKMFDINVKSTFLMVQAFSSMLQEGSSIVIVSSIAAYNGLPNLGVYSVTKTALLGLTKVLANELGERGIRVNAVAPGIIKTKFSQPLWDNERSDNTINSSKNRETSRHFHIPLQRIGEVEDVSGVVAFLISKDAAYITGETIIMAGGASSRL